MIGDLQLCCWNNILHILHIFQVVRLNCVVCCAVKLPSLLCGYCFICNICITTCCHQLTTLVFWRHDLTTLRMQMLLHSLHRYTALLLFFLCLAVRAEDSTCRDLYPQPCARWQKFGFCSIEEYKPIMHNKCKATCGYCNGKCFNINIFLKNNKKQSNGSEWTNLWSCLVN